MDIEIDFGILFFMRSIEFLADWKWILRRSETKHKQGVCFIDDK